MGVNATFTANFSNFQDAVAKATTTLKDFGDGADKVGGKLTAMSNSLTGKALVQQATEMAKAIENVGGVSMLTEQELARVGNVIDQAIAKMKALGMEVPKAFTDISEAAKQGGDSWEKLGETITKAFENPIGAMKDFGATFKESVVAELGTAGLAAAGAATGLTAVGVAMFELTEKAAGVGAGFLEMSEKTSMSVAAASDLSTAVGLAGGSAETMSNAVFMLQKRLDDTGPAGDKTRAAIEKLGISVEQFEQLTPDQQILALSDGFRTLEPGVSKAGEAFDLFGRQGRDMLPQLMKPLSDLVDKSRELGATWSEDDARAAEEFEIQLRTLKAQTDLFFQSIGRDLLPVMTDLVVRMQTAGANALRLLDSVTGLVTAFREFKEVVGYAQAATDVFSGSLAKLPKTFDDTKQAAADAAAKIKDNAVSPDNLVKAWEAAAKGLGDAWKPITAGLINQGAVEKDLTDQVNANIKAQKDATKAAQEHTDVVNAYLGVGKSYLQVLDDIGNEMYEGIAADLKRGVTVDTLSKMYGVQKSVIEEVARAEKPFTDANNALMKSLQAIEQPATKATVSTLSFGAAVQSVGGQISDVSKDTGPLLPLIDQLNKIEAGATAATAAIKTMSNDDAFKSIGTGIQNVPLKLPPTLGDSLDASFESAIDKLPGELTKAFSSGDVKQAFSSLAESFANTVTKPIMKQLSTAQAAAVDVGTAGAAALGDATLGKTGAVVAGLASSIGGVAAASAIASTALAGTVAGAVALGAATFGIGAAAVGVVALVEHFTKLSQSIKDGRAAEQAFEQTFGGSEQMIDAISAAYANMGKSGTEAQADIKAMFDAENQGGAATVAAIIKINDTLDASAKKTQDVATGVDAITSATQTLGGTAPAALQPMIKTLESMPGLTDDEKKSLDGLLGSGTTDYAALTKMASGYGLTLEQLGPKFEQADISGRADQIVKDFGDLTDAGADAGAVMDGMGTSISTLVDDALKYGSSLPTALKPIIEHLQQAGELTDDTGKKLDDISGIKFDDASDPLAKGIATLTDAINNLVDVLTNAVPKAAGAAADGITKSLGGLQIPAVHVPVVVDTPTGGSSSQPAEHHATGGVVGFPGSPQGTDTVPAWLTPGEVVLTPQEAASVNASLNSSQTIHVESTIVLDNQVVGRAVTDYQSRNLQARRKLSAA